MKVLNSLLDLACLCGYLSIIVFCLPARLTALSNETDMLALLALKNGFLDGTGNDIPLPLSSWNASLHFCQWPGITCDRRHQRVTALDLAEQRLTGTLSPHIGNLTFLRFLNLSDCNLKGVVPEEIGQLSRLRVFSMRSNALRGSIPLHLTNCSELHIIDLSKNGLTGTIPRQLGSMSKLEILFMRQNNFTGDMPSALGNISSLTTLVLHDNRFSGSIPSSLGKLRSLTHLSLGMNNLSGPLPSSLYNLSSLTTLSLVDNGLSGNILEQMGVSFPHLSWVTIANNYFSGIISPTIANTSALKRFDVGLNQLHGNIPESIGMLNNLKFFSVGLNNIGSGKIDDLEFLSSFANLSNLEYLFLMDNQFGGVIPQSVGNLSLSLQCLALGGNRIYGSIPVQIGNLINLATLVIERNSLAGEIPASIGNLYNLRELYLGGNKLSGIIPSLIGNLTDLYLLGLPRNQLEGSLPSSLQSCISLQVLNIKNNRLHGDSSLKIVSSLNQIVFLYMSGNLFTGHIPRELGNLVHLSLLEISDNKYSGEIPIELGKCLMLETLELGGNMFTGRIPLSLGSLKGVQIVDFSRNDLSGSIPLQFQDLSHLQIFNVSFNQLEGDVPRKGVFSNLSAISLQGNKKLCGGVPALMLPKCSNQDGKHFSPIIIVVTVCSILFLSFVAALVFLSRKRSSIVKLKSYSSMKEGYLRLSYNDLLVATDQFASSNLIGVGSFGSVYKGILNEGKKLIAVKVMDLTKHGAVKSYWRECKALSKIRHKNLLRIISCCSSLDFRGNDFMALVYELMPNGNLDSWLHESTSLKLEQRLDIAIDIASALDYLHNRCDPQIAHCDLKPSNVLLDGGMVAHVGDFGLAKLLGGPGDTEVAKEGSNTVAVKGTVGYIPPEYGMGGNVSRQGDMYSYGILLLEMITGKKPTDEIFKDGLNLHNFCRSAQSESAITDVLDPRLFVELSAGVNSQTRDDVVQKMWESTAAIAGIGIACSVESPDERMDIEHALKELHLIKRQFPAFL
ncbi:unnamed protein product [Rhodiola kirilowii]